LSVRAFGGGGDHRQGQPEKAAEPESACKESTSKTDVPCIHLVLSEAPSLRTSRSTKRRTTVTRGVRGPLDAKPVISPVAFRSPASCFFFSDDWLRHARSEDPSASLIFSNEAKRWLSASQVLDTICRIGQTQKTPEVRRPPGVLVTVRIS
jgi:hypothetical protein